MVGGPLAAALVVATSFCGRCGISHHYGIVVASEVSTSLTLFVSFPSWLSTRRMSAAEPEEWAAGAGGAPAPRTQFNCEICLDEPVEPVVTFWCGTPLEGAARATSTPAPAPPTPRPQRPLVLLAVIVSVAA